VDIAEDVIKALRKFRFQRRSQGNAAIVIKINKAALNMVVEEEYDNISIEDLVEGTIIPDLIFLTVLASCRAAPEFSAICRIVL
jgi:hypothetical protein